MSELLYDVVIIGEILRDFTFEQVKANLKADFEIGEARANELFSRKNTVFASALSYEDAEALVQKLKSVGADSVLSRHRAVAQRQNNTGTEKVEASAASETTAKKIYADRANHNLLHHKGFTFTGDGSEYFRIWIVNVVLTILTLGIYSAWAKVRNKQYFYGNTLLDGSSFIYRADPIQILRGRLIAFSLFAAYIFGSSLYPGTELIFSAIFFFGFPWLVMKSVAFNARYSEYRNVRFGFDGKYGQAWLAFIGWPMLAMFTLGLLFPHAIFKQQSYLVKHHRYGDTNFAFSATNGAYYKVFLSLIGMALLALVIIGLITSLIHNQLVAMLMVSVPVLVYLLLFVAYNVKIINLRFNHMTLSGHQFEANMELWPYFRLVLINTLLTVLTLGLFLPWAKVRVAQYKAAHISMLVQGNIEDFSADVAQRVDAFGEGMTDIFDLDVGF